jgi:hypothetical protein
LTFFPDFTRKSFESIFIFPFRATATLQALLQFVGRAVSRPVQVELLIS